MIQLILHLIGDYLTQSDWMAQNKTKSTWAAFCHATVYSLPFLFIGSVWAVLVIWSTHLLIDRFRLAVHLVYAKNYILQPDKSVDWTDDLHEQMLGGDSDKSVLARVEEGKKWEEKWAWKNCKTTGYPSETPPWLAVWLLIAAENTIHLAINYAALLWL